MFDVDTLHCIQQMDRLVGLVKVAKMVSVVVRIYGQAGQDGKFHEPE